jgi:DNA repair protein RadC
VPARSACSGSTTLQPHTQFPHWKPRNRTYAFWQEHVATSAWFTPDQECVISILLNVRCAVIGWNLVSLGTLTESIVHPREVLRPAVAANAYAFVLAHNHPSGNPTPSLADHDSTRTIQTAAAILKIHFVDHIIIGAPAATTDQPFFSFRQAGLF